MDCRYYFKSIMIYGISVLVVRAGNDIKRSSPLISAWSLNPEDLCYSHLALAPGDFRSLAGFYRVMLLLLLSILGEVRYVPLLECWLRITNHPVAKIALICDKIHVFRCFNVLSVSLMRL